MRSAWAAVLVMACAAPSAGAPNRSGAHKGRKAPSITAAVGLPAGPARALTMPRLSRTFSLDPAPLETAARGGAPAARVALAEAAVPEALRSVPRELVDRSVPRKRAGGTAAAELGWAAGASVRLGELADGRAELRGGAEIVGSASAARVALARNTGLVSSPFESLAPPSLVHDPVMGEPYSMPAWSRYGLLAAILVVMAVFPPLAAAAGHMGLLVTMSGALSWGSFAQWPLLGVAVAALAAWAGIPLRRIAYRLSPWEMRWGKNEGEELLRKPSVNILLLLLSGAAMEEVMFRGFLFGGCAALLSLAMPLAAALATAALVSSIAFALVHGYGSVWTRVVGGLLYCGLLTASGSLFVPILAHFFFNLIWHARMRRAMRRAGPA